METRPCGQLAPPGSAPRPGPGVAETPRRGASHAWSRKKALVLVRTRRPSACSRGPPGGSAADEPDQEPRADAGSTPGGAPITPLRRAAPGSRGGRRPWALPGTSVELHSALSVGAWSRSTPHPTQCTQLSPEPRLPACPLTEGLRSSECSAAPLQCPRNTTLARVPPPNCPNPCLNHHIKQGTNPQTRSWKGCALERSVQPQGLARPQLRSGPGRWPGMSGRVPLAERALSEGHARRRYRDTSLLIWQQQQRELESVPPGTYLSRSRSMWYSQYGNEAILVRDRNKLEVSRDTGQSRFCSVM